ncbi:hypothetical protein niasHT_036665 [Heterodera trifolii]|uniref:Uncharacterized protein n=1 Tax=Heterodera trifolii TaxID=157864 RepID=A0ABD2I525_9BILA
MVEVQRIYAFLALFTFIYFLESIGGTYMIASVQNIERQFRIPSKLSGFLVSAHDISYVLTVVFVSYYGSRGNRAKWIGFGTFLIACAHIITAMSNFLFRAETPQLNFAEVEDRLRPNPNLLAENVTIPAFFDYAPIRDRIPARMREMVKTNAN